MKTKKVGMLSRGLFAVLAWLLAACAAAAGPPGSDVEKEKAALMATDASFSKMSEEKGALAAFLAYADEAVTMLPANANPAKGKEGVRSVFSDTPADYSLVWKPVSAEASRSGDLGYTIGTSVARFGGADGKPVVRYGKYLTVWKKQPDGSWKFIADIGNPSPPPGAP